MSRPPPDNEAPGIKGKKGLNMKAVNANVNDDAQFKGKNVNFIRKCSDMPELDWSQYTKSEAFPVFRDGYDEELFYDANDKNALLEQTELARELEIYARSERRHRLQENYKRSKEIWIKFIQSMQEQQNANSNREDTIEDGTGGKYVIVKLLGQGQFGTVYSAQLITSPEVPHPLFAMKVAKPDYRYRQQAHHEVSIMQHIQNNSTEEERKYILKYYNCFVYRDRLCIINEQLSVNLYEVLQKRRHQGLPLSLIQSVMKQLCHALVTLEKCKVVHSDIKPENVLLVDIRKTDIKLVDFGSARFISHPSSSYIQSRYYRAPEVVLGLDHDYKIDVWSVACVGFELFLAFPLFPGQNEIHLIELIVQMLGPIPLDVVDQSPRKELFLPDKTLKSEEQICAETGKEVVEFKHYLTHNNLDEIIYSYELFYGRTPQEQASERKRRALFIDFLKKMLDLSPERRLSAKECLSHPFITTDLTKL